MAKKAQWQHIKDVFYAGLSSSFRMLPKLTEKHLNNLQFSTKMKVKLAVQILSHSVAAALNTSIAKNESSSEAAATSEYCQRFNDLFDHLNSSSSKDSVPFRRPLHQNSKSISFLKEQIKWLEQLQALNKRRCSFINGFIQSIQVVLELNKYLTDKGYPYLATRRLCQDGLELFFGKVRHLAKYPDPYTFSHNYARCATASLIREPTKGNCEAMQEGNEILSGITTLMTAVSNE